jgi:PAS domain S-box-containing protein
MPMEDKTRYHAEAWSDALDEKVIALRKRWLDFSPEDELLVQEIDQLLHENIDPLIEDMYAHFLSFEKTRSFFPDQATLERAQNAQKRYFLRLCQGNYDRDYVAQRLVVGETHYRIGLDPTWYLGAYNRVFAWCRQLVHERYKDDFEKGMEVIGALTRLVFFDMGLAIEAYSIAKEDAIKRQRDAIRELETERRVANNILRDAPVGIIQLNNILNFIECNHEFLCMASLANREEAVGKPLAEICPYLDLAVLQQVIQTSQPHKRVAEYTNLTREHNASPTYFDWAVWPVRDAQGEITDLVATFTDATDRVMLHQQREDFVATLTHDLKTPILAANRAIKLLLEGDFGKVEESQQRILETIHQSNESMYKMVQTLLDVYRYESGLKSLNISAIDLGEMASNMVEEFNPLAQSRGITLEAKLPDKPSTAMCDEGEIRRVMQNLVDNALKFTPSGGRISLRVSQTGSLTSVSIEDSGKGIPDEDKPKLFQRFWAAASSGRYYASTGLGLYLCRKIIELHGGTLSVDSTVGKGSTFHFNIPNGS